MSMDNRQYLMGYPNPGYVAALEGRAICGWVNDQTGIAAETVLTASTFLQPIPDGQRVVITCFYMHLSTNSDWVTVTWGYTEHDDGSGNFTAMTPAFRIDTGTAASGASPSLTKLDALPMMFTRAQGHAFTAQVQGNDAGATMTLAYQGYLDDL